MSGLWSETDGPAGKLRFYASGGSREGIQPLLLLCPELPTVERARGDVARPYEAVADRVAQESGWRVVAGMFRGLGGSAGSFSPAGWLEDARALVETELGARPGLRAAGFGLGGAVALALGASDPRVRGVACFAAPGVLALWAADPGGLAEHCRALGLLEPGYPEDVTAWAGELGLLEPATSAARMGGRPVLVVHGSTDDVVASQSAAELVRAAGSGAELRMVLGAGHWLRADPRAIATLVGWLERQS